MSKSPEDWSFDLETAVNTWRQFASRSRSLSSEDLDELETHLRDTWDSLVDSGMSGEAAFRAARRDIGDLSSLERWYDGVALEKRIQRGGVLSEIKSAIALAGSYLTAARRSLARHPSIAALNICGIGIGLASIVLIGAYILHSLSYDRYHPDADRIVRINQHITSMPDDQWLSGSPFRMLYVVEEMFSGAELVTSVAGFEYAESAFTVDDVDHLIGGVIHTDQHFLEMFSVDILEKNTDAPLSTQGGMVLTRSTARRMFPDLDPLGRVIRVGGTTDYTVEAVVDDPPSNTHLPFNVLIRSRSNTDRTDWRYDGRLYARLAAGTSPDSLVSFLTTTIPELRGNSAPNQEFRVERLTDIHLHSTAVDQYATVSDVRYLWIFGSIGVLIALLAGINYTNMATAQSLRRAREVGVRKVVGATRSQLRRQVIGESLVVTAAALPVAAVLIHLAMPHFEFISGESLSVELKSNPVLLSAAAAAALILAVGAGWYPAIFLARLSPASAFTGRAADTGGRVLSRILVGFQVTVSFAMIAATLVVSRQMTFVQDVNLGYDQSRVVTVNTRRWSHDLVESFRSELAASRAVESVAAGIPPGINWRSSSGRRAFGPDQEEVPFSIVHVGPEFFEAMDIEILEGRGFRAEDRSLDPPPVVVTESWRRLTADSMDVVGTPSEISYGWSGGDIVGVSEDILNESLLEETSVLAFIMYPESLGINRVVARLAAGRIGEGIADLSNAFERVQPDGVFTFDFLDDQIQRQYEVEHRLARSFDLFAFVSVFVALLGLFGLATLTAGQRVREIGIRKVLGASATSIVLLLSRDFLRLVVIGAVLTIPPVLILGNRWLDKFSRHISIGPGLFLFTAGVVLTLVLMAVGIQACRAALANPVDSIRQE